MAVAPSNWKTRLIDSSWFTVAWDWLQNLLTRAVDFILWVTMIFACYQLIPGAPQPDAEISVFMFICQFVALDIGGIGLNKVGMQRGLGRWSYTRVVAYILIGITLVTVAYAGFQHAVPGIPHEVTIGIEVVLVVARSIMIVLYGIAIHHLKHEPAAITPAEMPNILERIEAMEQRFTAQIQSERSALRTMIEETNGGSVNRSWGFSRSFILKWITLFQR